MARPRLTRRKLLAVGGTTGTLTVSGCLGGPFRGIPIFGTGSERDGEIRTEPTDAYPDWAPVIHLAELPGSEQELVRTAIESGFVRVCLKENGDQTDTLQSFANRMDASSTYLEYENNFSALWVRIGEKRYTHSTGPPEDEEDPCR